MKSYHGFKSISCFLQGIIVVPIGQNDYYFHIFLEHSRSRNFVVREQTVFVRCPISFRVSPSRALRPACCFEKFRTVLLVKQDPFWLKTVELAVVAKAEILLKRNHKTPIIYQLKEKETVRAQRRKNLVRWCLIPLFCAPYLSTYFPLSIFIVLKLDIIESTALFLKLCYV